MRSVVQFADRIPTTPTTKNRHTTIDHNPPHPVSATSATASDAMQLTSDAAAMMRSEPRRPTSRVFVKLPIMMPTTFRPNSSP